jgi:hypothetical protein
MMLVKHAGLKNVLAPRRYFQHNSLRQTEFPDRQAGLDGKQGRMTFRLQKRREYGRTLAPRLPFSRLRLYAYV